MAIYAADIQINVKNKGDLKKLENRFEKLSKSSVKLEKTLKNLSKRNVVQVDTKAAFAAIQKLETKIRGLSRTIRVDATTSGGGGRRESGGGGAAMPIVAAALGTGRGRGSSVSRKDLVDDLFDIGKAPLEKIIKQQTEAIKVQDSVVESYGETARRATNKHAEAIERVNAHQKNTFDLMNEQVSKRPWAKYTKDLGPAGKKIDNMLDTANAFLATNSKTAKEAQVINKLYVDEATERKKIKELAQGELNTQKEKLSDLQRIKDLSTDQVEATIEAALRSKEEIELHKRINQQKAKAVTAAADLQIAQSKVNKELVQGRTPAKELTNQLEDARVRVQKAAKEVVNLRKQLNTAVNTGPTGLIGGMKSLGVGGAGKAFGKGALGASAMIPGLTPFTIGAAAGGVGKTGGAMLAGGAMGIAGAGAVMGGLALTDFIKQATIASSEMKKMELALTAVVTSNEEYNKALTSIDEISNKLLIPQAKVTKAFTRLQAAASASGYEVNDVKDLMKGFSSALIATEGDAKNFNGVMLALSQVLGKGKAAAEELRGQIGERLSVVIPELAASMKITVKELDKLFDQGLVTVQDIFNLSRHLEEKYGKSSENILKSQMNAGERLLFAMTELQLAIGPIFENVGAGFQNLGTTIVKAITPAVNKLSELLGLTETAMRQELKGLRNKDISFDASDKIDSIYEKTWIPKTKLDQAAGMNNPLKGMAFLRKYKQSRGEEDLGGINVFDLVKLESDLKRNKEIKDLEERLNVVVTGKAGTKADGSKDDAKLQASWEKAKKNLEDQKKFQDKLNEGGTAYAERWRKINDLASQFPDKPREEIEKLVTAVEKAEKAGKSAKAVYEDWLDGINKRLRELENPMYQLTTLVDAASDSFRESFKEMVKGTKSVGDAFIDMFNRIADAYLDMVADTLAAQASKGITSFVSSIFPNVFGSVGTKVGNMAGDFVPKASGGYVDRPTKALIGEAGPEYVLREDQMAGALARFSSGQRGQSVIPVAGSSSSGGIGGGGNVTVSYTGPTLNFNGDEYVPRSSVPEIINAAARQGAKAGEAKMMSNLRNNRGTRASVGL